MILLIWLFWAHTAVHWDLFSSFASSSHDHLPSTPTSLPLPSFSHPSLYIFLLSSPLLPPPFLPLPPSTLSFSSTSSLSLSPLPPFFPPFSCFPYSTVVGGEIQAVEAIMKWLTPRQDGAVDPLTPNALMSALRPLLRLSKLKYRTLWGQA